MMYDNFRKDQTRNSVVVWSNASSWSGLVSACVICRLNRPLGLGSRCEYDTVTRASFGRGTKA